MTPPAIVNLTIYQGSTFYESFYWQVGNPATPVDLTGFNMRMQIRSKLKDPFVILELTTQNGGIVITDVVNGGFALSISAIHTANLNFNVGFYDLEVIAPDGVTVNRLLSGQVTLSHEVTR